MSPAQTNHVDDNDSLIVHISAMHMASVVVGAHRVEWFAWAVVVGQEKYAPWTDALLPIRSAIITAVVRESGAPPQAAARWVTWSVMTAAARWGGAVAAKAVVRRVCAVSL